MPILTTRLQNVFAILEMFRCSDHSQCSSPDAKLNQVSARCPTCTQASGQRSCILQLSSNFNPIFHRQIESRHFNVRLRSDFSVEIELASFNVSGPGGAEEVAAINGQEEEEEEEEEAEEEEGRKEGRREGEEKAEPSPRG